MRETLSEALARVGAVPDPRRRQPPAQLRPDRSPEPAEPQVVIPTPGCTTCGSPGERRVPATAPSPIASALGAPTRPPVAARTAHGAAAATATGCDAFGGPAIEGWAFSGSAISARSISAPVVGCSAFSAPVVGGPAVGSRPGGASAVGGQAVGDPAARGRATGGPVITGPGFSLARVHRCRHDDVHPTRWRPMTPSAC
ncbi:hypothetical protein ACFXGA_11145 [Actinosynnema sp. NPDC059335]|uniref:hypothetical protein n=1 Tax=Actinosynnema sp. NPDC059335 TaxID=3346804 RepID=UPI003673177F